jgi:hypothetical protein
LPAGQQSVPCRVDCQPGQSIRSGTEGGELPERRPLAEEQVTAASKEKVLEALGEAASKLRSELGESLATVQKFDVPLAQATTSSLEALKAYSLGNKAQDEKGPAAALPYHQRAIELDLNFATGYKGSGPRLLRSQRTSAGQRVLHQGIPVAGTCKRTGKVGDHRRLLPECNRGTG